MSNAYAHFPYFIKSSNIKNIKKGEKEISKVTKWRYYIKSS